ncbi:MAG: hypothetical protein M3R17_15280 [Bacteroidota bacterium]|nr:hypothetical protein [Bacteroidota bacterium]
MKKILTTLLICSAFTCGLRSQISVGSHIANINFLSGTNVHGFGFGGTYIKAFTGKFLLSAGANLYLGGKQETFDTAFSYSATPPTPLLVGVTRSVFSYTGSLDFRVYVAGDAESEFGVYAMAGVGIVKGKVKTKTIDSYDQSTYQLNTPAVGNWDTFDGLSAGFGAGAEKNIGNNYLYLNAKYNYVALYFDGGLRYFAPKSYITFEFGLRHPFR